jgi:hypothetical protein
MRYSVIAVAIVVIAAMIVGAFLILGTNETSGAKLGVDEIRIGALVPLTGPFAQLGSNYPLGFQLAIDEIKRERRCSRSEAEIDSIRR